MSLRDGEPLSDSFSRLPLRMKPPSRSLSELLRRQEPFAPRASANHFQPAGMIVATFDQGFDKFADVRVETEQPRAEGR